MVRSRRVAPGVARRRRNVTLKHVARVPGYCHTSVTGFALGLALAPAWASPYMSSSVLRML